MSESSWVRVEERRTEESGGYGVSFEVTVSYGVPKALFVFRYEDDAFSHVATVDDVERWPDSREAARAGAMRFYRGTLARRVLSTRERLAALVDHVRQRLTEVTNAWDGTSVLAVPGESVYVLGGDP